MPTRRIRRFSSMAETQATLQWDSDEDAIEHVDQLAEARGMCDFADVSHYSWRNTDRIVRASNYETEQLRRAFLTRVLAEQQGCGKIFQKNPEIPARSVEHRPITTLHHWKSLNRS